MNELKPCPFCGSKNVKTRGLKVNLDLHDTVDFGVYVICRECGASTRPSHSIDDAIAAWNNRAIDRDKLLRIAEELEVEPDRDVYYDGIMFTEEVLKFDREMAALIRKAIGE